MLYRKLPVREVESPGLVYFWHFWAEQREKEKRESENVILEAVTKIHVFSAFMHLNWVCCFKTNQAREIIDILPPACAVSTLAQALFNAKLLCE